MSTPANISLLVLPVYYFISMLPHLYAVTLIKKHAAVDNRNPRFASVRERLQKTVGKEVFARYERAESAHYNSLESFPLFAAAVLAGTLARLPPRSLSVFAGASLGLRAAYILLYINTTTVPMSFARSAVWNVGLFWSLGMLVWAGWVLA